MSVKRTRVLFVCLGNICRSPLAEAIFQQKINSLSMSHLVECDSCGTSNFHIGDPPDRRTIENARKNGINISHLGRQISPADLESFDHILVMDQNNFENVLLLDNADAHRHKVRLMRDFDPHDTGANVPDPYYGGEAAFQHVFEVLDRATESFIAELRSSLSA